MLLWYPEGPEGSTPQGVLSRFVLTAGAEADKSMRMADPSRDPVPADYRHRPKIASPGPDLVVGGTRLKWYELRPEEYVVPEALDRESRALVAADGEAGRVDLGSTMGFVILHIAGRSDVALLLVQTWRNSNEIWETVYLKDLAAGSAYRRHERSGHLPTFCVWELGIVWHERNAFERYLYSRRDEAAARAYFADRFSGRV